MFNRLKSFPVIILSNYMSDLNILFCSLFVLSKVTYVALVIPV